jgi:hypothetical protein
MLTMDSVRLGASQSSATRRFAVALAQGREQLVPRLDDIIWKPSCHT